MRCSALVRSRVYLPIRASPIFSSTTPRTCSSNGTASSNPTDVVFRDEKHLMQVIERIVSGVGRRIDESTPMVDARLKDGSRVNVIIPPLALDGPAMSIRRFQTDKLGPDDLVSSESMTAPMLVFLKGVVASRLNVVISGGTGSGKTTLLNILSNFISADERIVTVEDAAELMLRQPHVVRLETRPPNVEGKGGIRQRQLVINALRMRPDRIVVGEVRGEEALDMLQAMNTGHDGSLTTIHANSPRDSLYRLDTMVAMANLGIPERAVRHQVASAIDIIIQVSRLSDGSRPRDVDQRDHRDGAGRDHDAGDLRIHEEGHRPGREGVRRVSSDWRTAEVLGSARHGRISARDGPVRAFACGRTTGRAR